MQWFRLLKRTYRLAARLSWKVPKIQPQENLVSRAEWDKYSPELQYQLMYNLDYLVNNYQKVLQEIPECSMHGNLCVPHAIEWVHNVRALSGALAILCDSYNIKVLEAPIVYNAIETAGQNGNKPN